MPGGLLHAVLYSRNPTLWPCVAVTVWLAVTRWCRPRAVEAFGDLKRAATTALSRSQQALVRPPSRAATVCWALLWVVLCAATVFFEYEFRVNECRVSDRYYKENTKAFHTTVQFLEDHGYEYWLEFATLLTAVRGQDILPWDHDTDLGLPYPPDGLRGVEALRKQLEQETGFWTKFDASRDLLQAFPPDAPGWGPHTDLFLMRTVDMAGEQVLHVSEGPSWRPLPLVYPTASTSYMGRNVSIPAAGASMCRSEYGPDFHTPRVYRADCVHNTFNGRKWY